MPTWGRLSMGSRGHQTERLPEEASEMWSGNGEHRFRAASVRRRRRAAWLLGNLHRRQQAEGYGREDGEGEGKVELESTRPAIQRLRESIS